MGVNPEGDHTNVNVTCPLVFEARARYPGLIFPCIRFAKSSPIEVENHFGLIEHDGPQSRCAQLKTVGQP